MSFTEPEIRQALMEAGSLLPMNAKAVEELERTNPLDDLPLPPGLAFERILGRIHAPRPAAILKFRPPSAFLPAVDEMARAARNGGELSDDVITQMQEDRLRIEGQSK